MESKMKRQIMTGLLVVLLFGVGAIAPPSNSVAQELQSLRGSSAIPETSPPPEVTSQTTDAGRFSRAYRQQPPLIPHEIDDYQIDLQVNICLTCHEWPNNEPVNAPKVSETHYIDRSGTALDHVSPNRWFCTQCHVPQANTRALVGNQFKSAAEVE